ncbi:cytochrome b [Acidisoma cellulosilytica]|uniref:Cytochrome b n=1 Tax=Acidisoma cellulosilyticum TaxID=2802395 RepID=A0A963Z6X0_9PROT|nr:cytochrome b [Acidisoma cellulosilyticum]MCB8883644.1 cytochrome b [Acidisoma cellulosilyticum]
MRTLRSPEGHISAVPPSYDHAVIALHWLTAILVVTLFALAEVWSFLPDGHLSDSMQSLHISLGMLLAAVMIMRIGWRTVFAKSIPPAVNGLQHFAATAVHLALYTLLACQVVLGFLYCWGGGPAVFFGIFSIPSPIKIGSVANNWIGFLHYYNAWLIICLAGAHACVALLHHYVQQDHVLSRMIPFMKNLPRHK